MAGLPVTAIVVLGGDGTHRVVAGHCGDISHRLLGRLLDDLEERSRSPEVG